MKRKKQERNAMTKKVLNLNILCVIVVCALSFYAHAEELSIFDIYDCALKNNEELKIYKDKIDITLGEQQIALSEFLPDVATHMNAQEQSKTSYATYWLKKQFSGTGLSGFEPKNDENGFLVKLTAEYNIFNGLGHLYDYKKTRVETKMAKLDYDMAKTDVLYDVAEAYFNVLTAEQTVFLNEKLARIYQDYKENAHERFHVKQITELESLEAENQYLEAVIGLTEVKDKLQSLRKVLNLKMGRSLNEEVVLGKMQEPFDVDLKSFDEYLQIAHHRNNELSKSRLETKRAENQYKSSFARSPFVPHVSLYASLEQQADNVTAFQKFWEVGVSVKFNIFDGFEAKGKQKKARAQLSASKTQEHMMQSKVHIELEESYNNLKTLLLKKQLFSQRLKVAQESLRRARVSFQNKVVTELKLLEAQANLERAKIESQKNNYELHLAYMKFNKNLGGNIWVSANLE